jgi:hypothetical protein
MKLIAGGHRWGNAMLTGVVGRMFGNRVQDAISGYKVFSRRFVRSISRTLTRVRLETELTIHALELAIPVVHVHRPYKDGPLDQRANWILITTVGGS